MHTNRTIRIHGAPLKLAAGMACMGCRVKCLCLVMRYHATGRATLLMSLASAVAYSSVEGLLLARASVRRGAPSSRSRVGAAASTTSLSSPFSRGVHHSSSAAAFTYPAAAAAAAAASASHSSKRRNVVTARLASRTDMSTAAVDAAATSSITLDTLPFDNRVIRELPVDPIPDNYVRRVENACFSVVAPDPVVKPVMVAASNSALGLLGLAAEEGQREDAAEYFSGKFSHVLCFIPPPFLFVQIQDGLVQLEEV